MDAVIQQVSTPPIKALTAMLAMSVRRLGINTPKKTQLIS